MLLREAPTPAPIYTRKIRLSDTVLKCYFYQPRPKYLMYIKQNKKGNVLTVLTSHNSAELVLTLGWASLRSNPGYFSELLIFCRIMSQLRIYHVSNKVRCHHRRPLRRSFSLILNQHLSKSRVIDRTKTFVEQSLNVSFFLSGFGNSLCR